MPPVVDLKHSWSAMETKKSFLMMAGMGMGTASKSKKKKGGSKKQNSGTLSFDVPKSLLKSEKIYDKMSSDAAKALNSDDEDYISMVSEYVIAARGAPTNGPSISDAISDWVPVAQLCIKRPVGHESQCPPREDRFVQLAISHFRREIFYAASLSAPIFNTISRNTIQYSVEPLDSFQKFVYDEVIEGGKNQNANNGVMTKSDARRVLNLTEDCNDAMEIKKSYRSLLFSLHPDRFVGIDRSEDEVQNASNEFSKVRLAYESLTSGLRSSGSDTKTLSWYESLGGRSRTDFSGAIEMIPVDNRKDSVIEGHKCAVAGLTSEVAMAFVTRNQASTI
eukprot:CAMPEP_0198265532 /NCGR_PEP_ID=MMETSP1447-20131203/23063_1 /TAXON_ID=420782 /ORGANISM="Chaetoceros dichaeta, Strain CCMP1751" /LENGTH=334 /DNA_ID=CAMNT_0043955069 /DNA_START=113 /DNA_END=1117 /DNA_ORIENTATION=-